MRAVIQRVRSASVRVEEKIQAAIGSGLLILLGIEELDSHDDIQWLVEKIAQLRIFDDASGVMNISLINAGGEVMVVSQFTLHASTRKGNRPSYVKAAKSELAFTLYKGFIDAMQIKLGKSVEFGSFGKHMLVSLINDGPVTIIIDSKIRE